MINKLKIKLLSLFIFTFTIAGGFIYSATPIVSFNASDVNPDFTFNYSNPYGGTGGFDLGYEFTVTQSLQVSALGFYSFNPQYSTYTLQDSHWVGLYDYDTGQLIAKAKVTPNDNLINLFRYANLKTDVTLTPGVDYELMAVEHFTDVYTHDPNNIAFNDINFIANKEFSNSYGKLHYATYTEISTNPPLQNGWFGPNLLGTSIQTPEPSLLLSLISMGFIALSKRFYKTS